MGLFDKKLREDKLDELSFIDCVKWIRDRSKTLSYEKGSNEAYWEATEIIQYFIKRFCFEYNLRSDTYHLNNDIGGKLFSANYDLGEYGKYDKAKCISSFKADMDEITERLIYYP